MIHEKTSVASKSVFAAAALVAFKLAVGLTTGSLGILSEALHSLLDFIAAIVTWISVRISDKPADRDHNFGHAKFENIAALIEGVLLLVTCVWIIYEAVKRLQLGEHHIEVTFWSFAVMIISIAVDIWRSRALMKAAKKYKSSALEADALHFSTDILSSTVVLFGLVCAALDFFIADTIAALGVAIIVIWISIRIFIRSINTLLDKAPEDVRKKVSSILHKTDGVIKSHNLRIRSLGAGYEIDVNIHVDPNLTIVEAHDISEKIERMVRHNIGEATINIHVEPEAPRTPKHSHDDEKN